MITGRVPTQLPNLVHQATFHQPHFRLEISLWLSTSTLSPPALDDFFLFSNHRKKNFFVSWLFLFVFHKLFRVHFWNLSDFWSGRTCTMLYSSTRTSVDASSDWSFERQRQLKSRSKAPQSTRETLISEGYYGLSVFRCSMPTYKWELTRAPSTQVKLLTMHWNYSNREWISVFGDLCQLKSLQN